jgi:hypothetical protein
MATSSSPNDGRESRQLLRYESIGHDAPRFGALCQVPGPSFDSGGSGRCESYALADSRQSRKAWSKFVHAKALPPLGLSGDRSTNCGLVG